MSAQELAFGFRKCELYKVGIGLEFKGNKEMEWYAEMMAGNFDITYWTGEYEYSLPHCFFGVMASMTPHTFSLSQVGGSQEFFDSITAVKQTSSLGMTLLALPAPSMR